MVAKTSLATLLATFLTVAVAVSLGASLNPTQRKLYDDIVAGRGFYNHNTRITVLNSTNFKEEVFGKNHAWIVEFYNSWCGACQRFASIWKAFAEDIYGWRDVVTVAAVDCASDINYSLCREYEIMKYPSLRFLGAQVKPGDKGQEVEKTANVDSIRHSLVDVLKKEQAEGRGATWPNISPYRSSDVQNLWKTAPAETRFVLLVFEEPESHLGAELSLDVRLPEAQVRYASAQNEALAKLLSVASFPALVSVDRAASAPPVTLRPPDATRADFRRAAEAFLAAKGVALPPPEEGAGGGPEEDADVDILDLIRVMAEEDRKKKKQEVEERGRLKETGRDVVHQVDLDLALRYSLGHEVPLAGAVSGAALRALGRFTAVAARLFPASPRGRRQLEAVRVRVLESASLDGADLLELVSNASAPPLGGPRREWKGCQGSAPKYRGYPCGLWTLFHTLTVAAAAAPGAGPEAGREVLDAVLGYVTHFFGCQECSKHFQDMAAKPGFSSVRDADAAVLWLWRAHNEANARLSGDVTEDPDHPKVQFPAPARCPDCRGADGSWREDRVLAYLKRVYGEAHIVKDDVDDSRAASASSLGSSDSSKTGWNLFNDFDVSICVLLYVFSAVVLCLAFLKFLVRKRYRKKLYVHDILGKV